MKAEGINAVIVDVKLLKTVWEILEMDRVSCDDGPAHPVGQVQREIGELITKAEVGK